MQKPDSKTWLRTLAMGLGTVVVLAAVVAGAVAFLGVGVGSAEGVEASPFAFDAPAQTVAQANAWQKSVDSSVTNSSVDASGQVVLDDWTYTGIRRTRKGQNNTGVPGLVFTSNRF